MQDTPCCIDADSRINPEKDRTPPCFKSLIIAASQFGQLGCG